MKILTKNFKDKLKFVKKNAFNLAVITLSFIGLAYFSFPNIAEAAIDFAGEPNTAQAMELDLKLEALANEALAYGEFPVAEIGEPKTTMQIPVTAYTSTVWQCDDTPFITASGTHVRDGIIAANFLPIGTKVRFPELYGDKVFVVEDRMNERYYYKADIWMEDYDEAIQFGVQYTTIEIF